MASRILAQAGPSNPTSHILSRPSRITAQTRTRTQAHAFSTSAHTSAKGPGPSPSLTKRETHYETLGISPGSSRMEIKAAYFRLSKRYHPDVRRSRDEDVGATERFHEVSAAYAVLSDDRERRAYDRALSTTATATAPLSQHRSRAYGPHTPGSSSTTSYAYEMHARRRRGATHAWEGPRGHSGRTHTQYSSAGASANAGRHYDPSSSSSTTSSSHPSSHQSSTSASTSPNANANTNTNTNASSQPPKREERLTGRQARAEEEHAEHDRIVHESNVGRFFRALGIVLVVSWIGGLGRSLGG